MGRRFHFVFEAADYDAAVRFYGQALGLPVVESWDRGADRGTMFAANDGIVEVVSDAMDLRGPHRRGVVVEVDDVDALEAGLRARGVPIERPTEDRPWGTREMILLDPDGHAVTFFTAPG
jgi:catechol 2,3-dioxygenase-like lactoylglutathione lyase family enzyme